MRDAVSIAEQPQGVRLSVLVLTYNHERYISACLRSLDQLAGEGVHFWILDDGSEDRTAAIVQEFAAGRGDVRFIQQNHSNGKTSANAQRLIDASVGEYLLMMSGDDLLGPDFDASRALVRLDSDPALAVVFPRMVYLMQNPAQSAPACHEPELLALLRRGSASELVQGHLYQQVSRIFLQAMIIRRSDTLNFSGFDVNLSSDDFGFVMRLFHYMKEFGKKFEFDEDNIWLYRVHSENIHGVSFRQFSSILEVVHKYVPIEHVRRFRWDAMVFGDHAEWRRAYEHASSIFGHLNGMRSIEGATFATARAMARRGEVAELSRIFFAAGLPVRVRTSLAPQILRAFIQKIKVRFAR